MRIALVIICLYVSSSCFCQQGQCDKCNLQYITWVNKNFNKLSEPIVERFLCSLSSSCDFNPKFTQISNNTLYAVMQKNPKLLIYCLNKYTYLNKKYILDQIRNPYSKQDFEQIYSLVKMVKDSSQVKNQITGSIKIAALKYHIKIQ